MAAKRTSDRTGVRMVKNMVKSPSGREVGGTRVTVPEDRVENMQKRGYSLAVDKKDVK